MSYRYSNYQQEFLETRNVFEGFLYVKRDEKDWFIGLD